MDFSLNQEQEMFRGYVRKYLDDAGQTKTAREFIKGETESLQSLLTGMAELGCTSINISENYGGMGLGPLDLIPVLEETGRSLLPGLYLETNALVVPLLEKFGTEEQKERYLSEISNGTKSFSLAWLEPGGSYNPSGINLVVKEENNHLILNGVKSLVPDAELADHYIVLGRTSTGNSKEGISLIIIDRTATNMSIQSQKNIDETRRLAELTFTNVEIPMNQILGPLHHGWETLQEGLLSFNAALSAVIVGSMEKVVEMAVEYAKIREQFGQPIGRFQAIKHRIVDMKMDLETARSLAYYANWALESNAEDRVQAISCARLFATDAFTRISSDNIQIHGGIGFTEEIDCHLFVKRARFYENYLGSTEHYYNQAATALGWSNKDEAIISV
ncbi:acyl-CoA dehydrogenase family protein [Peribacillus butanolivorans]|uniref:Acyl-CoA dehydrogenase n=1 Tax=Peribacillus butanolivorans TaxID=421767 RepID=A0AAX0RSV2_9BACI|nr:acyl-CoA dehydrogenase family protein [Peribacillus butanolivorans]AXN41598.1 acyl-CoA dehydrogenase [Peribacillus butanolivorans]PEJ36271.1 acyl-CoA dehydrogenase [Peribacillus butanolivorans]QNU04605.1 acyl-CoA/acyl-ACP dehydrogenase [Peribacillus butanolivorans]